jgi:hypothetical protein
MRKRFVLLLRMVVETYGGSLINDRIADTVAWAVSPPQLAFYIRYAARCFNSKPLIQFAYIGVIWSFSNCKPRFVWRAITTLGKGMIFPTEELLCCANVTRDYRTSAQIGMPLADTSYLLLAGHGETRSGPMECWDGRPRCAPKRNGKTAG